MTDRQAAPPPIIRPRALAPGDTIAIAALSGGLETEALELYEHGVAELTALGYRVRAAPLVDVEKVWWWAAARPEEVARELNELFRDPEPARSGPWAVAASPSAISTRSTTTLSPRTRSPSSA